MFDLEDHLPFRQYRGRSLFLGLEVFGQISARIIDDGVRVNVGGHYLGGLFGHGDEILNLAVTDGVIERIRGGHGADQNQHDESHALLAVVRAVEEADAGAGQYQQAANPKRRRCVALRRLEEPRILDDELEQQAVTHAERTNPNDGRNEQRTEDIAHLRPIHAARCQWHPDIS